MYDSRLGGGPHERPIEHGARRCPCQTHLCTPTLAIVQTSSVVVDVVSLWPAIRRETMRQQGLRLEVADSNVRCRGDFGHTPTPVLVAMRRREAAPHRGLPARHLVRKVGASHRGHMAVCSLRHLRRNVVKDVIRGRGGEGAPNRIGKAVTKGRDVLERRAKIVSPLADAMGLVDDHRRHVPESVSRFKRADVSAVQGTSTGIGCFQSGRCPVRSPLLPTQASARMPLCNCAHWSSINATSGVTTKQSPPRPKAGS